MDELELSKDEKRAIAGLKRLAKTWPSTLWLFTNGSISILKTDAKGAKAHTSNGGIDPDYVVADIVGIVSDGGDW
jgi:hypothetical protein